MIQKHSINPRHVSSLSLHIPSLLHRQEELKYQVEVREEMAQLEGALASVKHDYEILRIEFEKTIASNEQAAPIAK